MSAEEIVFQIDDLRKYIFKFLRSKAHVSCRECKCVLEWNEGIKKVNYLEWGGFKPICHNCFRNIFFSNNVSCSIS